MSNGSSISGADVLGSPSGRVGEATWMDYVLLLKPRVMSLVIFTAFVGMLVAPGTIHPVLGFTALLCIAVGAGASGALNMWYDADIDTIMQRTRKRPIPRGVVGADETLAFGVFLSAASVLVMALAINIPAALLLAGTIGFYVFIYTMWLKRRTPQNIVIGGAAGAFPPMIGWTAVTGSLSIEPVVLFLIIFMWTPPHFWALSLYRAGDYEKAGVPMLPVVSGVAETRRQIVLYTVLLLPITLAPVALGFAGWLYLVVAGGASLTFLWLALKLWWDGSRAGDDTRLAKKAEHTARNLFRFSIYYLFIVFFCLLIERLANLPTLTSNGLV